MMAEGAGGMLADDADADRLRAEAIREEELRLRELRVLVDLTTALIVQGRPDRDEAERLVAATHRRILELFPDKSETYDLILAPRFARLLAGLPTPARVLPFRRRA